MYDTACCSTGNSFSAEYADSGELVTAPQLEGAIETGDQYAIT